MENENIQPAESEDILTLREPQPESQEPEEEAEEITPPAEAPEEPKPAEEPLPAPEAPEEEAPTQELPPPPQQKPRRNPRGALLFFSTLFGLVLCALILLCCVMLPLTSWFEQYEASNPKYVRDEVYEMLFADPDWDLLYDLAGVECTVFEGKEAFASYMDQKVGNRELVCTQTSDGLSGKCRYILTCGGEEIAAFTLASDGAQFPTWYLSTVQVYFEPQESVTVIKAPEYTVYINGIPLDESYTTLSCETAAETYLPDGLHGYRWEQQEITGLLFEPEISVLDENNNPVTLFYSAETDIYTTSIPTTPDMTEEEQELIVAAAEARALFAIRAINSTELRQHFDPNSQAYADVCDTVAFRETYKSYEFEDVTLSDFYRYSDELFSVHVSLKLKVTVKKNDVSTYLLDITYMFEKNSSGHYTVTQSTDADLTEQSTFLYLSYEYGGEVVRRDKIPTGSEFVSAPSEFGGEAVIAWCRLKSNGELVRVLELQPDGTYLLAFGQTLEAMTLYPLFE